MSELLNSSGHTYAEIIDLSNCNRCALCCQICPDLAIQIEASDETPGKPPVRIHEMGGREQESGVRRRESGVRSE